MAAFIWLWSHPGCKVSDAIWSPEWGCVTVPWHRDTLPRPRVLTYQPHCPVLCPNMSQCHETSDITSHTPGHLTSHGCSGPRLLLKIGFCKIMFQRFRRFFSKWWSLLVTSTPVLEKEIGIFYNEMKLSIWRQLTSCHRHSIVNCENRGPKWASASESLCVCDCKSCKINL